MLLNQGTVGPLSLASRLGLRIAAAEPKKETLLPKLKLALGGFDVRLHVTTQSALRAAWATAYPQS